jgi:hypothetical protein
MRGRLAISWLGESFIGGLATLLVGASGDIEDRGDDRARQALRRFYLEPGTLKEIVIGRGRPKMGFLLKRIEQVVGQK